MATGHYDLLVPYRYKTEEIVFVVELLIQGYFLKKRNATYGENFYGFKRSAQMSYKLHGKKITAPATFKNYHVLVSLFFETALPFLKLKL